MCRARNSLIFAAKSVSPSEPDRLAAAHRVGQPFYRGNHYRGPTDGDMLGLLHHRRKLLMMIPQRLAALLLLPGVLCIAICAGAADNELTGLLRTFREEFVAITPGEGDFPASFTMGDEHASESEQPAHKVAIAQAFEIGRYEVPQNLWQAVMGQNPSRWKGKRNSVEMLSYDDAVEFCRRATAAMRQAKLIAEEEIVRLPSEAEWEYAARAGSTTRYSFGDDPARVGDYGWYQGNAAGNDPAVGAKQPNAWKLYDVHGYLWEWCADIWHDDYRGAPTDGSAWIRGDDPRRVLRGGSWKDPPEKLTSSARRSAMRQLRDDAVGLRCVLAREKR